MSKKPARPPAVRWPGQLLKQIVDNGSIELSSNVDPERFEFLRDCILSNNSSVKGFELSGRVRSSVRSIVVVAQPLTVRHAACLADCLSVGSQEQKEQQQEGSDTDVDAEVAAADPDTEGDTDDNLLHLEVLRLVQNRLSAVEFHPLELAFTNNTKFSCRYLTHLCLRGNPIGDGVVRAAAAVVSMPGSKLKVLDLSATGLHDLNPLAIALEVNRSSLLTELQLNDNGGITPSSLECLCEVLSKTGSLAWLSVVGCGLSLTTLEDVAVVLKNATLNHLQIDGPGACQGREFFEIYLEQSTTLQKLTFHGARHPVFGNPGLWVHALRAVGTHPSLASVELGFFGGMNSEAYVALSILLRENSHLKKVVLSERSSSMGTDDLKLIRNSMVDNISLVELRCTGLGAFEGTPDFLDIKYFLDENQNAPNQALVGALCFAFCWEFSSQRNLYMGALPRDTVSLIVGFVLKFPIPRRLRSQASRLKALQYPSSALKPSTFPEPPLKRARTID